jgi:hypothetical protein
VCVTCSALRWLSPADWLRADATEAARSEHAKWDEVGEAFVKELDFTHVLLKLNSAEKDTQDEVYADMRIDLRSFLEASMVRGPPSLQKVTRERAAQDKPGVFELEDPTGGHKIKVVISTRYMCARLFCLLLPSLNDCDRTARPRSLWRRERASTVRSTSARGHCA